MRIIVAIAFAAVGILLVLPALPSLMEARFVTHQIFAMMQIIAGLLCFLISAVAGLMRPGGRAVPTAAPHAAPPQSAAERAAVPERNRTAVGYLIVLLAMGLIAVAAGLRKPDDGRDAVTAAPAPTRASTPTTARPLAPATSPSAKSEAKKPAVKPPAPPPKAKAGKE